MYSAYREDRLWDGWMDGWTDGRTDREIDVKKNNNIFYTKLKQVSNTVTVISS